MPIVSDVRDALVVVDLTPVRADDDIVIFDRAFRDNLGGGLSAPRGARYPRPPLVRRPL